MGCQDYTSAEIGRAFACTLAAGLATLLGTAALFIAPLRNNNFIAGALAFASGVLMFVSLVDIYGSKSMGHFTGAGQNSAQATLFATLCFFGGMPIAYGLDLVSNYFTPSEIGLHDDFPATASDVEDPHAAQVACKEAACEAGLPCNSCDSEQPSAAECGCAETPVSGLSEQKQQRLTINPSSSGSCKGSVKGHEDDGMQLPRRRLLKMGLLAGLVIAFHNLPEGLVTFLGYLDNIQSGVTTAVAIAIHNIPEGIIVAIPIYYATHNRAFAILLSGSSAVTEPIGALIGLAVACTGSMNDVALGVVFGLVAGIMVYISLKELLPMARQLDPDDKVSTLSLFMGMAVMAGSLIAIQYTDTATGAASPTH